MKINKEIKINILGSDYNVNDKFESEQLDGMCKIYDKLIAIRPMENMLEQGDNQEAKEMRWKETMRHEIIHAFCDECGLVDYSNDEQLVSWLARQFPKMLETFKAADCI